MKKIIFALLTVLICSCVFAQKIEKNNEDYVITGNNYVARTSQYNGGYLASFVVNREEFLEQTVDFTRGTYFYRDGVVKGENSELNGNILTVNGPVGKVTYDFQPDKITVTANAVTNCNFYTVLSSRVKGYKAKGELSKTPINNDDSEASFIIGRSSVRVFGDMIFWGPFTMNTQVVDLSFQGEGTKSFTFEPVSVSEEDSLELSAIAKELNADIILYNPKNYQVFQRETKTKGYVKIDGKAAKGVSKVAYKIQGKDLEGKKVNTEWIKINSDKFGVFSVKADCRAGGWYTVSIKYTKDGKETVKTIENVGVGEVIIGSGQSNSTNFGPDKTETKTKMVSSTDGKIWQLCLDPQPGTHDGTNGGSLYPTLGDALYNEFKVPIGIASTGFGGTNTFQWQPDAAPLGNANLFNWFMMRVLEFGPNGFRCVLWHQGESDNGLASSETYFDNLANIITESRRLAGWYIPWFTAKVSCWSEGGEDPQVREGQQLMWDRGVSFEGPDTDTLWGEDVREANGRGVHFAKKGLELHGNWWAKIIAEYIHSKID